MECFRCKKDIVGSGLSALGHNYHPACFSCKLCGNLIENKFFTADNDITCLACNSTKCNYCGKPIEGEIIEAAGKSYHGACFVCCGCKAPITKKFGILSGKVYCSTCRDKQELEEEKRNTETRMKAFKSSQRQSDQEKEDEEKVKHQEEENKKKY